MKTRVTDQGIIIPKEMLNGAEEVDIQKQEDRLIIVPVSPTLPESSSDPLYELGAHPVSIDVDDASIHHDRYLNVS
ncbi:MAG: hypothetical protein KY468_07710 [Armatimonadetes bacterium]|nr:hypothetical protein [Armatimonadota bacterium]